jgi:prepilin-type processing-associated H-X9-DG protein
MLQFSIRKMMLAVVVFAVICAVLAARERARAESKKRECEQRLRNVAATLLAYLEQKAAFPPGTCPNPDLASEDRISLWGPPNNWLDLQVWWNVDQGQAWNDPGVNDAAARFRVSYCACPEAILPARGTHQPTSYIAIAGVGVDSPLLAKTDPRAGVFGYDRQTTLADIKDGASSTMLIAETAQTSGSWFQGGPATVRGLDPAQQPYIGPARQFGGLHAGGAYIVMADGSVRWISESTSATVFEALSTIAGGENLPANW